MFIGVVEMPWTGAIGGYWLYAAPYATSVPKVPVVFDGNILSFVQAFGPLGEGQAFQPNGTSNLSKWLLSLDRNS